MQFTLFANVCNLIPPEDAALMRLLPDAAEAQVFSECVGNPTKLRNEACH